MKRTAATFVMLAGLGGCASPNGGTQQPTAKPFGQASVGKPVLGVVGPDGGDVHVAAGQMPTDKKSGVTRADFVTSASAGSGVKQTAGFARIDGTGTGGGVHTPGVYGDRMGGGCADGSCGAGGPGGPSPYGPMQHGIGTYLGHGGIMPVPSMGPAGAVAAVGAIGGPGSGIYPPMYAGMRTSIRFGNPAGMRISWQGPGGAFVDAGLEAPVRYNFPQGAMYRLRLSNFPNRPGARPLYPTLEVYPATPNTVTFLSHNTVPVAFTDEDFEQVATGNLVVKVIYLPSERFQDLAAVAGADEVVSTRLEPGVNPVDEANRRGTILAVIRVGNIDLQDPNTPAMDAPPGMMATPPGALPPRTVPLPGGPVAPPLLDSPALPEGPAAPKALPVVPATPVVPLPAAPKSPAPLPSAVKAADTNRLVSLPSVK